MKKIVSIVILFFVGFNSFAQDTAQVTIVNWAGGVCCTSGERFSIYFKLPTQLKNLDSMELDVDGMGYRIKCLQSMEIKENEYLILFNISNANENYSYDIQPYYEGIEAKNIYRLDQKTECLRLYSGMATTIDLPIIIRREIIAYP